MQIQKLHLLECRKFESVDWHKVKVAFKFYQIWRLLTVSIVIEHIFDSWNRYYRFLTFYVYAVSVNEIIELAVPVLTFQ